MLDYLLRQDMVRDPHAKEGGCRVYLKLTCGGPWHLRLTGMIFFEKVHGQIGGAPNGLGLHPVLKVEAIQ